MKKSRSICIQFLIGILLCASSPVSAQKSDTPQIIKDESATMEKIADGVYVIIHDYATDEWPHGNSGVIVGEKNVLVVDANYLPSRSRADIALIRKVTDKPVKYLVFTHWHFDHNNGTIAYKESFPNIEIISERRTQKFIELNGIWWAKSSTAENSNKRKSLKQLESSLADGKDKDGKVLSEDEKKSMDSVIVQRKNELAELETMKVVAPNKVFDTELKIELGGKTVMLKNWGQANSPNDVTVYLPKEQILFTGDILVQAPRPYVAASWPLPWAKVLKEIEKLPVKSLVPGHGPVQHDHGYTIQMRTLLETTASRVEAMILEGKTLDQIQATINMDDLYKGVWDTGEEGKTIVWKRVVNDLVERLWRGIRGQG